MYDLLKEHHSWFPQVSQKTVFNFVQFAHFSKAQRKQLAFDFVYFLNQSDTAKFSLAR
jgi:hypothetical protein